MTRKRLEGQKEPILEPGLPIIDAHHHLFDRPALRYLLDDYISDVRLGHKILASVYVETQAFERVNGDAMLRPLGEIEFANGVGAMAASGVYGNCRVCEGIVSYADLRHGAAIGSMLDQAMALSPERFKGVRQVTLEHPSEAPFRFMTHPPPSGILAHPGFRPGLQQLSDRGLSFDAAVFHNQLADLAALADMFPALTIVLNHAGMAMGLDVAAAEKPQVFRAWQQGLCDLARRPNVFCKVGGLGLPSWGFGFDLREDPLGYEELAAAWRPYVETAIEAFGAQRCMMESDFPPDGRSCGFVPLWNALKHIVRGASHGDKVELFHGTAARVYKIDLARLGLDGESQPTS